MKKYFLYLISPLLLLNGCSSPAALQDIPLVYQQRDSIATSSDSTEIKVKREREVVATVKQEIQVGIEVKENNKETQQTATPNGTYTNVDGEEITRPYESANIPIGASARCRDGTFSFSAHRQGTCSHHGGVAEWLN